ncbi:cell division protein FtsK, partial [Agrobacterium tumefaciens]
MHSPTFDGRHTRFVLTAFFVRQIMALAGFALLATIALGIAALATWNVADPSLSYATGNQPTNLLGYGGAIFADIVMQFLGLSAIISLLPVIAWAIALIAGRKLQRIPARLVAWIAGAIVCAASLGCFPAPVTWPLPNGIGGVIGDMILRFPALFIGAYPTGTVATILGVIFAAPAAWLMLFAAGIVGGLDDELEREEPAPAVSKARAVREAEEDDEDDGEGFFANILAFGALTHYWYITQARFRRLFGLKSKSLHDEFEHPYDFNEYEFGTLNEPSRLKTAINRLDQRAEPSFEERTASRRQMSPPSIAPGHEDDGDGEPSFGTDEARLPSGILSDDDVDQKFTARQAPGRGQTKITAPSARPKPSERVAREAQASFIAADGFQLPTVHLLAEPKNIVRDNTLSEEVLEQNARLLEGVLEDFGVKGEIIHVRPGPVVTLYELEPAPGIKSSRVIGLADDIARSMSAIAARVAVVPGRNAIGIELPNQTRETVFLRELIGSRDFENSKAKLAMALGKTIGGEPVIADLAKMPHLLVAGTTGSGKSVAINTMIL